ncbi:MAG: hypothetical protein ACYS6W_02110 [Planctomycetota bacterium]|jgi:hypothetical protein
MAEENSRSWQLNRRVNVSVLLQLVLLASLIVGSWVNLQRQLDLLQRDVTYLCQCQKDFQQKLESLSDKSITYEYRLRAIEKHIPKADIAEGPFGP